MKCPACDADMRFIAEKSEGCDRLGGYISTAWRCELCSMKVNKIDYGECATTPATVKFNPNYTEEKNEVPLL